MTESLLDGSYWALSTSRRQSKRVVPLTYAEDHIPLVERKAPASPMTEEQKQRQKERQELRRSIEKKKVEEEIQRLVVTFLGLMVTETKKRRSTK